MPAQALNFQDLEQLRQDFDARILEMPEIDRFCSSSSWILAARESFHASGAPAVYRFDDGYLAMFRESMHGWGKVWLPMEAAWCLSCPLIGEAVPMSLQLKQLLFTCSAEWDTAILTGLPLNGILWNALIETLAPQFRLFGGPEVSRRIASLKGGVDGFLSRRSSKFRGNLKRAQRLAEDAGLTWKIETPGNIEKTMTLFSTMMDIEARSWKGLEGVGVNLGHMRDFYERMLQLLAPEKACRMVFAVQGDQPIGYIMGGVMDELYRGFQFSFDSKFSHLSLGNLLQMKMIEVLSEEGLQYYDLGTEIEYKRRWAEKSVVTHAMIIKK